MKVIRQPNDKLLLKIFNKKQSIVETRRFRGFIKVTRFRRYHRYCPVSYPNYSHILDYQFEVEIKGVVFGRLWDEQKRLLVEDWYSSSVVTNPTFSKRRFNILVKNSFVVDEVVKTARLLGMQLTKWDIKVTKITWA